MSTPGINSTAILIGYNPDGQWTSPRFACAQRSAYCDA